MVHFPVALLLAAPVLLVVSLFAPRSWRTWAGASLVVMALGSLAAWLAVASGHAAGQLVDKTPALAAAIAAHEALGVMTLNLFTWLTVLFAVLMLLPAMVRRPLPAALRNAAHVVFLLLYLGCATVLVSTGSRGGRLVHEAGVRAIVGQAVAQVTAAPTPGPAQTAGGHEDSKQK
jgi:uncharacterized membrane protein